MISAGAHEEWRVTGTLRRSGRAYSSDYPSEGAARALLTLARAARTFTDGPHLQRRTATATAWQGVEA